MKYFLMMVLVLLAASSAHAETGAPCDAAIEIKGCRAKLSVEGKWLVIRTDTSKCARVEWQGDGMDRSTTVLDGEERLEILIKPPTDVRVMRCVEVKDLRALSSDKTAPEMLNAVCKNSNGIAYGNVLIQGNFPTQESRAAAIEEHCLPVYKEASEKCVFWAQQRPIIDEALAIENDPAQRARLNQLRERLRAVQQSIPAYCPKGIPF